MNSSKTFAEFFAGIGLVRSALERVGFRAAFSNDIEQTKFALYAANFGSADFALCDVRYLRGDDIPTVDLATASFPCTDLSLAGQRRGLAGEQSGLFWEFARIMREMGERQPTALMLENVPSFATSNGGRDLRAAISELNDLGYWCDLVVLDARSFVPQSRQRLFIIGSKEPLSVLATWQPSTIRPAWIQRFVGRNSDLRLHALPLKPPLPKNMSLSQVVERLDENDSRWWSHERTDAFKDSLRPLHRERLDALSNSIELNWSTAYRRTRDGKAVWEIRQDSISGCLRTSRGGSSKQAIVEGGRGAVRVRWMTHREYARLQGAPDFAVPPSITEGQALFGFGDAVCVPVVEWLAEHYLRPLLDGRSSSNWLSGSSGPIALPLVFNAV